MLGMVFIVKMPGRCEYHNVWVARPLPPHTHMSGMVFIVKMPGRCEYHNVWVARPLPPPTHMSGMVFIVKMPGRSMPGSGGLMAAAPGDSTSTS